MASNKPLILVDGSSYLYRAFHALPPLTNSHGEATGAVYGVVNMLRKLLATYEPERIGVVFDAKGKTFRHQLYPDYKANRPPMPDELAAQIEPLHQLVAALGLPLIQISGVEADDVIGTLARVASAAGEPVVISTSDKDMAQLVDERVTLIDTMSDTTMDVVGVREKFGILPEQIVDYLALVGDSSDNIPGVPKVGPKTAAKWLTQYGSLQGVVEHAENIGGRVGESLRDNLNQLPLAKELATIRCDLDLNDLVLDRRSPAADQLSELYRRLEFKRWLAELSEKVPEGASSEEATQQPSQPRDDYEIVLDQERLASWLVELERAGQFAFDTETTSLNAIAAEIVGVSFAVVPGTAAYVPLAHDYPGVPAQLDRDSVLEQLRPLLESEQKLKIGQNLKYDLEVLANYGISMRGIGADTMLESYVLNSVATRHDMDSLANTYLNRRTIKYEEVAGKGAKQIGFSQVALEVAGNYAAEDADITLQLHETLARQLRETPALEQVYHEIELPLIPVLAKMERAGVLIDTKALTQQSHAIGVRLLELEQQAHCEAGQPFNLASPKQLQEILFGKMELPVVQKTPKGQPSTNEAVLQELAQDYRLPQLLLEHRGLSKLKSTYTDRLPEQIYPGTGRVHTSFHQAVTATGRLSSSDPNLQNIPVRSEAGRQIRQAFIAPPGQKLVAADYSQIELRIMAHLSEDKGLLAAFAAGRDIHCATAAEVFDVDEEVVSAEQRRAAKAINFGLIYGMSAFGLSRQLGIKRSAAQTYVERYFERYPGVKHYMDRIRTEAAEQGYVETIYGRRLYLPQINARNGQLRAAAERTAINAPMQGSAADIIKRAMIAVNRWLEQSDIAARMIMQVHDELVFEVAEESISQVSDQVAQLMQNAAQLLVNLEVDVGVGVNWDEAH